MMLFGRTPSLGGFSIESVARGSCVHETTIYRRWPTREALLVYALDARSDRDLPIPNTGSLRGDLRQFGELVMAKLTSAHGTCSATMSTAGRVDSRKIHPATS